jgi:hypothetical protein
MSFHRRSGLGARCGALAALAICVLLTSVTTAVAQVSTGGIRGFVKDKSGGVLVGVAVEASSPARIGGPAADATNEQGLYRFENLPVGKYRVTFTLKGFKTLVREGIRVELGRTVELRVTLTQGEGSVTVTGEAPVVDAVHPGSSTNFNQELLESLPTTRSPWSDSLPLAPR